MSETNAENPSVRVSDRRRVDVEGNVRADEGPVQPPAQGGDGGGSGAAPGAGAEAAEVAQLRQDLETARRRVDELARGYQALQQDREEFKVRLNRERDRLLDVERGTVAVSLLEAIDELDLCLAAGAESQSALAAGVRLIRDKLLSSAMGMGIERLKVVGQRFDPAFAEAADMEIISDPDADQKITAELRAGYRMKDRVIRAARVRVTKYIPPASA